MIVLMDSEAQRGGAPDVTDQVSPEQLNRLRFGLLRDLQILLDG